MADTLILAGDIGSLYKIQQLVGFLEKLCPYFGNVIYVPGNHEWYTFPGYAHLPMSTLRERLHSIRIPNLYILDRGGIRIDDVCIIGATLWSDPDFVPNFLVRIDGMNTEVYRKNHLTDLAYIEYMIEQCQKFGTRTVVVTHYPPTKQVLDNDRKKRRFPSLYATDLDELLDSDKVHTWICGHTHSNFDLTMPGGCRVVSNQLGKPKDHVLDYDKKFLVTV
jgi:predicted phosphohydrolase